MSTISPKIFPNDGLRPLTPKETMQRAKALNCIVAKSAKPSCSGQLNIGLFFDGTGNNMDADLLNAVESTKKHSNVVKLYNAYTHSDTTNENGSDFRFYIPGVGTPFPQIGEYEGKIGGILGGAFAWNGETRVTWAFTRILNACHLFVSNSEMFDNDRAATIAKNMASMFTPPPLRREILRNWQKKLAIAIANKKPKIEIINLSIFGFSRGAAEARAFSNWLFQVCEKSGGGYLFAEIPIRVNFLGILDTVASVGIPNALPDSMMEGHQSWADGNMEINPAIEQCVHFVAGHEVRASFPLDSVRVNNQYPANAKEVMYPGAHSDVGGGYARNAVGIGPKHDDSIAIIPGAQMYQEARLAGVVLYPWSRLDDQARKDFTPSEKTIEKFNAYLRAVSVGSGPVEEMHRKNMSLYLSYRYKYRNAIDSLPFYRRADAVNKSYIRVTTGTFNKRLSVLTAYHFPPSDERYSAAEAAAIQRKMCAAAGLTEQDQRSNAQLYDVIASLDERKLCPEIEDFFGDYIHDSMAGFIDMGGDVTNEFKINGQGIMRYRKIFKGNG